MSDEEFKPFGQSALALLDALGRGSYETLVIASPSFGDAGTSNIAPQFLRGDFSVITSTATGIDALKFNAGEVVSLTSKSVEYLLDRFRYEHAIFASSDLSILTAWAQAEYAVMAFKTEILDQHSEWLARMNAMGVVRQVPR